jgi:hypothetical protein
MDGLLYGLLFGLIVIFTAVAFGFAIFWVSRLSIGNSNYLNSLIG